MKKINQNLIKPGGFSLIELLTVMGIIAILSTISIAVLTRGVARSRDTKQVDTLKRIRDLQEDYYFDNQAYSDNCNSGQTIGAYKIPQSPKGNDYNCYTITPPAGGDISAYCVTSDLLENEPGNCTGCLQSGSGFIFPTPTGVGNKPDRFCVKNLQ